MQNDDQNGDKKPQAPYIIIGSGRVGSAVARELTKRNKKVVMIDKDVRKVETLREQEFETVVGDLNDPHLLDPIDIKSIETILVLSSDVAANSSAIATIKRISKDIQVIARAPSTVAKSELEDAGADSVIVPPRIVADATIRIIELAESARDASNILDILRSIGDKKLAIVLHDNPDPDAMSSAVALKTIAASVGAESEIVYRGEIGHQENKAFVNLLHIGMDKLDGHNERSISDFKKIAMVDCSLPGENNLLPKDTVVDIIIDHHPVDMKKIHADHVDIRPNSGATATILTKYLQEMGIPVDKDLATALLYGIRTDTLGFKRNANLVDLTAAAFLYPLADHEILNRIETPAISTETLETFGEAIRNRKVKGSYLVTNAGIIRDRDALAQAADYLLNLEGVTTVLVYGIGDDCIHISGRSRDIRLNLGDVMQRAFAPAGSAGGHATMAGAQIPLGVFSDTRDRQALMRMAEEVVMKRFFTTVGVENGDE
ncbi:MAG: DHH family phosphoesterase [Euryarchaeota archaeon]|nr:DHH family phosphoesterase [Euryarchaeota archaeon]